MNRHPDRNRLRALDRVEPPDQWDDIVLRADSDLARLQLRPVRTGQRLLVAAVLLVLAGVAGVLVMSTSTGERGDLEAVAADGGSAPAYPGGGGGAPGTAATTPEGEPVPTTASDAADGPEDGSDSGGSSGSGDDAGGSSGSTGSGVRTTTTVAPSGTTTTVVAPSTSTTPTTVTVPADAVPADSGGGTPTDPPRSPLWGARWQAVALSQAGASVPMDPERIISVDARTEGELSLMVCNRIPATASIDGDRLLISLGAFAGQTCGNPADSLEAFMIAVFDNDPTFVVSANRLVLTAANRRVELTPY